MWLRTCACIPSVLTSQPCTLVALHAFNYYFRVPLHFSVDMELWSMGSIPLRVARYMMLEMADSPEGQSGRIERENRKRDSPNWISFRC